VLAAAGDDDGVDGTLLDAGCVGDAADALVGVLGVGRVVSTRGAFDDGVDAG
jgi:hypothetical protein